MVVFYIDFKSAYNCVIREILYILLERDGVLDKQEI